MLRLLFVYITDHHYTIIVGLLVQAEMDITVFTVGPPPVPVNIAPIAGGVVGGLIAVILVVLMVIVLAV